MKIYALTWDDVFKSFELRHSFILDKLKNESRRNKQKMLFNNKTQNEKQMVSELTQKAISRTAN